MPNQTHPWKNWIDWAKTLGMLCIVWGHTFPAYLSPFIYAFNVPVFFFLSGYLTKEESNPKVFFHKLWHNLIVPYLILSLSLNAIFIITHRASPESLYSLLMTLGGIHSAGRIIGCSNLWFVYTLIVIKVVCFYAQRFRYGPLYVGVLALGGMFAYNYSPHNDIAWAYTNALIAFPYFIAGFYAAKPKFHKLISNWTTRYKPLPLGAKLVGIMLMFALTYLLSYSNGNAFLYKGQYGHNYLAFLCSSITGISAIILTAHLLDRFHRKYCHLISTGSLIILAYHLYILVPTIRILHNYLEHPLIENIGKLSLSVAILGLFIPIIILTKRHFPIVLGSRANK